MTLLELNAAQLKERDGKLEIILQEIAASIGAYAMDRLKYAENVIENNTRLAKRGLAILKGESGDAGQN